MTLTRDGAIRSIFTTAFCLSLAGCSLHPYRLLSHRNATSPQIKVPVAVTEFSDNSLKINPGDDEKSERNTPDKTIRRVQFEHGLRQPVHENPMLSTNPLLLLDRDIPIRLNVSLSKVNDLES